MRQDMTDAERALWTIVRDRRFSGWKFRRQVPLGRYIADFVCFERRLILEADGSQHAENAADAVRTAWLESQGFTVLRFWNREILTQRRDVADRLYAALAGRPLTPLAASRESPSPARGEGGCDAPLPAGRDGGRRDHAL